MKQLDVKTAKPFLRWTGSKKWFVRKELHKYLPQNYNAYHEPFLGCGAVFFSLNTSSRQVFLNDLNSDLISTYQAIKEDPESVIQNLRTLKNSAEEYYRIRARNCTKSHTQAARFIYLNRTAFNGIYRVNPQGKFNVPYGKRGNVDIVTEDNLREVSSKLQGVRLSSNYFADQLENIQKGDLVYLDPPYTVAHENNGFIAYNSKLFSIEDQSKLADMIGLIAQKGAYFILSNAEHPTIRSMYSGLGRVESVERKSIVGGRGKTRGMFKELIIHNC